MDNFLRKHEFQYVRPAFESIHIKDDEFFELRDDEIKILLKRIVSDLDELVRFISKYYTEKGILHAKVINITNAEVVEVDENVDLNNLIEACAVEKMKEITNDLKVSNEVDTQQIEDAVCNSENSMPLTGYEKFYKQNKTFFLLNKSFDGRLILGAYLNKKLIDFNRLLDIVLLAKIQEDPISLKIPRDNFDKIAQDLHELFPTVTQRTFFNKTTEKPSVGATTLRGRLCTHYKLVRKRVINASPTVPKPKPKQKATGTYFILYDFIDYFEKDNPSSLDRGKFLQIINSIFKNMTKIEKEAIAFQYTEWENTNDEYMYQRMIADIVGDYFFICPSIHFAQLFADRGLKVYYYFFTQKSSTNLWGDWMGVMHGDEIEYVFGHPLNESLKYKEQERELALKMILAYSSFALHGKPMVDESEWPAYTRDKPIYYIFNAEKNGLGRGPRTTACAFWNEFLPRLKGVPDPSPEACSGAVTSSVSAGARSLRGTASWITLLFGPLLLLRARII